MAGRKIPVAVQMYSVRDHCAQDFLGAFTQVARLGYGAVELAGTGNLPAPEFKKHLDSLGLLVAGAHVPIASLEGDTISRTADYYRTLGVQNLICPWWPPERRQDAAGWRNSSRQLNEVGAKLRALGFTFCYHNHHVEFQALDGTCGWDLLFQDVLPQNVQMELDCGWLAYAGRDPIQVIRQYAGRVPLLHLRDILAGPEKKSITVGSGTLNWPSIFQTAAECGVQYYVVEEDDWHGLDSFDAVKNGLNYLQKIGVA